MSKKSSGLFSNTKGDKNLNTSTIWSNITPTQENYPGTIIPKSFILKTEFGNVWVHGNGTEHIYEAVASSKIHPTLKNTNPQLYSQFILYDLNTTISILLKKGIKYDTVIKTNAWELRFAKPRKSGLLPVIIHSKFNGLF